MVAPPLLGVGAIAMDHNTNKSQAGAGNDRFDLDALLHPAKAFAHPMDVVRDADLALNEKRAILASWASDACAVEAAPALRETAIGTVVCWDDIMDALRTLDAIAAKSGSPPKTRAWKRRRWQAGGDSGHGPQLY